MLICIICLGEMFVIMMKTNSLAMLVLQNHGLEHSPFTVDLSHDSYALKEG